MQQVPNRMLPASPKLEPVMVMFWGAVMGTVSLPTVVYPVTTSPVVFPDQGPGELASTTGDRYVMRLERPGPMETSLRWKPTDTTTYGQRGRRRRGYDTGKENEEDRC